MADHKKTSRRARKAAKRRREGPEPAADESAAESSKAVDADNADPELELAELKSIMADGGDTEGDDDASARSKPPSFDEMLHRLGEKNEIIFKLNRDNEEKDKQIKDLNEKWLRSLADFENYRKRSRKEWELLKQQSKTEVILEMLNTIDDFERAFSVAEDEDGEFVQGIRLIYNNLISVLDKFGVQEIETLGKPFDPSFHMAVGQLETEDVEQGHVAEVIQKGYRLDETVIRPARVIVAK